jgi:hypothetical protein
VSASTNLSAWTPLTPTVTATNNAAATTKAGAAASNPKGFYRVNRSSLATFDSNGY